MYCNYKISGSGVIILPYITYQDCVRIDINDNVRLTYYESVHIVYRCVTEKLDCDIRMFDELKKNIQLNIHDEEVDKYIINMFIKMKNIVDILDKQTYPYIMFDESDHKPEELDHYLIDTAYLYCNYITFINNRYVINDETVQMIINGEITVKDVLSSIFTQIHKAFNTRAIKSARN